MTCPPPHVSHAQCTAKLTSSFAHLRKLTLDRADLKDDPTLLLAPPPPPSLAVRSSGSFRLRSMSHCYGPSICCPTNTSDMSHSLMTWSCPTVASSLREASKSMCLTMCLVSKKLAMGFFSTSVTLIKQSSQALTAYSCPLSVSVVLLAETHLLLVVH